MLTTLVQGMTLEEATAVTPEELIAALDGIICVHYSRRPLAKQC